ncbi:MAG: helix-turn-helix transcriptional regulator [Coriobacteriia bacterium]|nr:helix-turn-helix transcriptional regulator [Coriobacteriia bacterium]
MNLLPHEEDEFQAMVAADRLTPEYRLAGATYAISEALYVRMEELGLTRKEFAQRMGVSPARITNIFKEKGNFTLKTLVEAAHALDCELTIGLKPREIDNSGEYRLPSAEGASVAAEARASYARTGSVTRADRSRDEEIRQHLASGKLRMEDDQVLMRHQADGSYHPAKFRQASAHSAMEKTNIGRRAYYRSRILAIARETGVSDSRIAAG